MDTEVCAMGKRHEVSDAEWSILDSVIPKSTAKTGRPARDRRTMLNGLLWILSTGAQWRDLPERFGPWETVYGTFNRWRALGVFDAIVNALHLRLDQEGKIDWDLWCIDGTSVRGSRSAAGASKKASSGIPTNPPTTHWAVPAGVSAASSTCLSTAAARRSKSK
jgi:transposase